MENQTPIESKDIDVSNGSPTNSNSVPTPNNKIKLLTLFVISLLGIFIIVAISYLFEQQSIQTPKRQIKNGELNSSLTSQLMKTTAVPTLLERNFMKSFSKNGQCDVQFTLPPKPVDLEEYGNFWDTSDGGSYPDLLTKLLKGNEEYQQSSAIYSSHDPGAGSGYIAQAVIVSCIPNNGRFTDNTQLISSLETELSKYNSSTDIKLIQPSTIIIESKIPTERWNNNVVDLVVREDDAKINYTMFVTPQNVYEVRILGNLQDETVKESAKQIFENLRF